MNPIEDAWMRRVVRFWNLLASLPTGHLLLELSVVIVFSVSPPGRPHGLALS
jgi:hypothetical protein